MKHSKIFLGLTSLFLAIAGVAATKIHHAPATTVYYLNNSNVCTTLKSPVSLRKCTHVILGNQCTVNGVGVYTDVTCINPAYYHSN